MENGSENTSRRRALRGIAGAVSLAAVGSTVPPVTANSSPARGGCHTGYGCAAVEPDVDLEKHVQERTRGVRNRNEPVDERLDYTLNQTTLIDVRTSKDQNTVLYHFELVTSASASLEGDPREVISRTHLEVFTRGDAIDIRPATNNDVGVTDGLTSNGGNSSYNPSGAMKTFLSQVASELSTTAGRFVSAGKIINDLTPVDMSGSESTVIGGETAGFGFEENNGIESDVEHVAEFTVRVPEGESGGITIRSGMNKGSTNRRGTELEVAYDLDATTNGSGSHGDWQRVSRRWKGIGASDLVT